MEWSNIADSVGGGNMFSLVYLTADSHNVIAEPLRSAGYQVWEVFNVAEALWTCSQHYVNVILIDAAFQDPEVAVLNARYLTIQLKRAATEKDAARELAFLLSDNSATA
jgi:CheY-like chemotaxis protein